MIPDPLLIIDMLVIRIRRQKIALANQLNNMA
jgi:hypothetical protein